MTAIAAKVVITDARVVLAVIMNMIIICNLAAWCTDEPPRIAPVIMPGMAIMPRTLETKMRYKVILGQLKRMHLPHTIDWWSQGYLEGLDNNRPASFCP